MIIIILAVEVDVSNNYPECFQVQNQGLHSQYLCTHKVTESRRQKFLKVIKKCQDEQMQHGPILSPHFPPWSSLGDEAVYRSWRVCWACSPPGVTSVKRTSWTSQGYYNGNGTHGTAQNT